MTVAPGDAPRLVLLERPGVVGPDADRVVPGGEALVAVGVGRRVQDEHHVLENQLRDGVLSGQHLIGDLHRRLKSSRLVAVHGILEHRDQRVPGGDLIGPCDAGFARVGQLSQLGADLIGAREVRGIGDDEHAIGAVLRGIAPGLGAHALGRRGDQRVEVALHDGVHRVLLTGGVAGDLLRSRYAVLIGTTGVEIERGLGGQRGHECEADGHESAHDGRFLGSGRRKCRDRTGFRRAMNCR